MKQLSPLQNILFQAGGLLIVAGAIMPMVPEAAPYAAVAFTLGALLFGVMQMLQSYTGRSIVIRRLRRQQVIGAAMLIVTGALMLMKRYAIGPVRGDEWKLTLLVAVVLELYTSFRIPHELEKEEAQ